MLSDHTIIEQIERTSFPEYLREIEDTPVEDMFGDEIMSNDIYFVMKDGSVVLEQNIGEYAVQYMDAIEKQAEA
ncbi:hypothetical protein AWH48_12225 [Domibacillus aminovorans]|uniref:Uncharacterized protein n=1 Tax=Domibacillus aminovorans TaxID=29332 RepID=A0A177KJF8_9BACI|nr:hypothetical protein [Domibacillus aminovorans]OAH53116.1 hypothetical protein AWH48_12225 [Domibacillus aminovorans]